jgi:hypothetical protein
MTFYRTRQIGLADVVAALLPGTCSAAPPSLACVSTAKALVPRFRGDDEVIACVM